MALSANDKTLYAAIGDSVTAFSTTTLKQTASYATPGPAFRWPCRAAAYGWATRTARTDEIGAIDLANGSATWNVVPARGLD